MAGSMLTKYYVDRKERQDRNERSSFAGLADFAVLFTASARHRPRDVSDLFPRMTVVDAPIQAAHPVADAGVLDLEKVGEIRRPHVEPLVRRAQQEHELPRREVRVLERRREAVEFLPVRFDEQRL